MFTLRTVVNAGHEHEIAGLHILQPLDLARQRVKEIVLIAAAYTKAKIRLQISHDSPHQPTAVKKYSRMVFGSFLNENQSFNKTKLFLFLIMLTGIYTVTGKIFFGIWNANILFGLLDKLAAQLPHAFGIVAITFALQLVRLIDLAQILFKFEKSLEEDLLFALMTLNNGISIRLRI